MLIWIKKKITISLKCPGEGANSHLRIFFETKLTSFAPIFASPAWQVYFSLPGLKWTNYNLCSKKYGSKMRSKKGQIQFSPPWYTKRYAYSTWRRYIRTGQNIHRQPKEQTLCSQDIQTRGGLRFHTRSIDDQVTQTFACHSDRPHHLR